MRYVRRFYVPFLTLFTLIFLSAQALPAYALSVELTSPSVPAENATQSAPGAVIASDCTTGDLGWPLDTAVVNPCGATFLNLVESDFGIRFVSGNSGASKYHFAWDLAAANGTDVLAAADGEIIYIKYVGLGSVANYMAIWHEDLGYTTLYYHLRSFNYTTAQINAINNGTPLAVSKGDKIGEVGAGHLDLRILNLNARHSSNASDYDNPAKYYPHMKSAGGVPQFKDDAFKVREGTTPPYKTLSEALKEENGEQYVPVDEHDIWVRAQITVDDKDLDDVKAFVKTHDGAEIQIHHFNYYTGTSQSNPTMIRVHPNDDQPDSPEDATHSAYVYPQSTTRNVAARDIFYVKVPKDQIPTDGKIHQVLFRATDAFGGVGEGTVPVKRKGEYKVDAKPDQEMYICCTSPSYTVEVRDANAEGNPLVDIDEEKESITAKVNGKDATIAKQGLGTYKVTTSEVMRNGESMSLAVKIENKQTKKSLGTGSATAKSKLPPKPPNRSQRCGVSVSYEWNDQTCQWEPKETNNPCQPDDNGGAFDFSATADNPWAAETKFAVLRNGFDGAVVEMLARVGLKADRVSLDFSPTLVSRYPTLFIPSGGLAGLSTSAAMKERLARYVDSGGTLVVFTQPQGRDFAVLPGGSVEGYGYDEDVHCVYRSAGISTFGAPLISQQEEMLSINIDGFFSRVPEHSTVLLRRAISGMPAMFSYTFGEGRVLATTSYADMAYRMGQGSKSELNLVRDIAQWSLAPDGEIPLVAPRTPVEFTATVANPTDTPAARVLFQVIRPEGVSQSWVEQDAAIPGGGQSELTFSIGDEAYDEEPPEFLHGLWQVNAILVDINGNLFHKIDNVAAYGFTAFEETPGGFRYQGQPYALVVTSESEEYLAGSPANFTFHVFNYSDTEETFKVTWGLPHHSLGWDRTVQQEITVPANDQGTFTYQLPAVRDLDRLRAILWKGNTRVAYAERGFWMSRPAATLSLAPSKPAYALDEIPALDLSAVNLSKQGYDVTGSVVVRDSRGAEVASLPVSLTLGGRAPGQQPLALPAALPYGTYRAELRAQAHGAYLGYAYTSFTVPRPNLKAAVALPDSPGESAEVRVTVSNPGAAAVPAASLALSLTNPAGDTVWQSAGEFRMEPGAEQEFTFAVERGPVMLGDYKLAWELTAAGEPVARDEQTLAAAMEAALSWDKPAYRIRETATATATVRNTGFWQLAPAVALNVANAGFSGESTLNLAAGEAQSVSFSVPLPETITAGSHDATLTATAGGAASASLPVTIPPSALTHDISATAARAGDTLTLTVNNTGGVDTLATFTATATDMAGNPIAESTAELSLTAAGSDEFTLTLPPGAADGRYTVKVSGRDHGTARSYIFLHDVAVQGVAGDVTVLADQRVYLQENPITLDSTVQVTKGALTGGRLNLTVYRSEAPEDACVPVGQPTLLAHGDPSGQAQPNPAKDALYELYLQSRQGGGMGLLSEAPGNGGWVGACDPVYNPWDYYGVHIYNQYVDVAVEPYDGRFTVGTIAGDIDTGSDDNQRLLYGHPYPWSSFTTLRVNGQDWYFGYDGTWIQAPTFDPDQKAVVAIWEREGLRVTQIITLVASPTSRAVARIAYQVENTTEVPKDVGLRIMMDTQLGYNDGAPFRILGQGDYVQETEFLGSAVPESFIAVNSLQYPSIVSQGLVRMPGERAPDRLVLGYWGTLYDTPWDYVVDPSRNVTWDSGVAYYWNPTQLGAGQSLEVATRYGASSVSFGTGDLSTVVTGPAGLTSQTQNPFRIHAFVRNNTATPARGVQAALELPTGLVLADENDTAARVIGDVAPGGEAEASWLVRANGQATGNLFYSVRTESENVAGSEAHRSIDVFAGAFDSGAGFVVWQTDLDVTTDTTAAFSELVDTLLPGKYTAVATLQADTDQVLGRARDVFYVAADQTLVTLNAEKTAFRPGESVTVSGKVVNLSDAEGSFTLVVASTNGQLLTETFALAPGQEHPYTATTTATDLGALTFEASAGLARIVETYQVALPAVEHAIQAPEVVGRQPFTVGVTLSNPSVVPATVTVSVGDDSRTLSLEPGTEVTSYWSLSIAETAQIPVTLAGDLNLTETLTVRQGENASLTVTPAALYEEGPVIVPFTLTGTGELATAVSVKLTVDGLTVEREYSVMPGGSLADTAVFALAEGEYLLAWETPYEQGQAAIRVRRPVLDRLSLTAAFPTDLTRSNSLPITLVNEGENRLDGQVIIRTPWNQRSLPFGLAPGATADLAGLVDLTGAAAGGTYPITVQALVNGTELAHQEGHITLAGPRLTVKAVVPGETAPGAETTFTARVRNTGDLGVTADVTLNLEGIAQRTGREFVAPGAAMDLPFAVVLPPDMPSGVNVGTVTANAETAPFTYRVVGFEGAAAASLDRPYYRPGEPAVLTLSATTTAPAGAGETLIARVSGDGIDLEQRFPAGTSPTFTFTIPGAPSEQLISYGLYLESGRSLYLNALRMPVATGEVFLYTDKQVYQPGETVTITVVAERAGTLTIFGADRPIVAGETGITFTLAPNLARGLQEIAYSFNGGEDRFHAIQVDAPGVAVLGAAMNAAEYRPGDPAGATLTLLASADMQGVTVTYQIEDPAGTVLAIGQRLADIPEGRSTMELAPLDFTSGYTGRHTLRYNFGLGDVDLNNGAEWFDMTGSMLLGVSTRNATYREGQPVPVDASLYGSGPATLTLRVDGQAVDTAPVTLPDEEQHTFTLPPLPAGTHQIMAELNAGGLLSRVSATVTVLPMPTVEILVSGDLTEGAYRVAPTIDLASSEPGVALYYRWNGGAPVRHSGEAITPPAPGDHILEAYAMIDGVIGPVTTRPIAFRPDLRVVIHQPAAGDYVRPGTINIRVETSDPEASLTVTLDGAEIDPTRSIDLFDLSLGAHTLRAEARDPFGTTGSAEVTFHLGATITSTRSDLQRMCHLGWVKNPGICRSLEAKLNAAQGALDRGQTETAINVLEAFLHEVEAQRGKHIAQQGADMLAASARYVIDDLR